MTTNKQNETEEQEQILTEEEVKEILEKLDVFECTDENLKLIRKDLKDIDPALQTEWERVYREKWKERALLAADLYSNINIHLGTDYYTSIITTIRNDEVPPFWTCCDPNLDKYREEAAKTGSKVDRMAVINCSVPQTREECEGRWGMFSNENIINVLDAMKEQKEKGYKFRREQFVRVNEEGAKQAKVNVNHLCMVLQPGPESPEDARDFLPVEHYPKEKISPMVKVLVIKDSNGVGGYPVTIAEKHLTLSEG